MRVVYFGTPQFAVPSLQALLNHPDITVAAVVTQPDKRRGRGGKVTPSPVKAAAIAAQLPVWQPPRLKRDPALWETLGAYGADAFVVVAYGQLLPAPVLAIPPWGCINAHGSLLPRYRGAAPIQWSLYHGEWETGVTTMLMDAGMDTGPMLLRQTHPIGLLDTAHDLAAALADTSAALLVATLQGLAQGHLTPEPQPDAGATHAPLIQKSDFPLDWNRPALALHNQVRGFYPHGVTDFRGQGLKILATVPLVESMRSHLLPDLHPYLDHVQALPVPETPYPPGNLVALLKAAGPVVQTGDGYLWLRQVQPQGKRSQSGADFANGSRLQVGEHFGA